LLHHIGLIPTVCTVYLSSLYYPKDSSYSLSTSKQNQERRSPKQLEEARDVADKEKYVIVIVKKFACALSLCTYALHVPL